MDKSKKRELLYKLIHDGQWQQVLVFTRSKHGANKLCDDFLRSIERLTSQKIKKVVVKGYEVDPTIQAEAVNLGGRGNHSGGQKRNSRPKQKNHLIMSGTKRRKNQILEIVTEIEVVIGINLKKMLKTNGYLANRLSLPL